MSRATVDADVFHDFAATGWEKRADPYHTSSGV